MTHDLVLAARGWRVNFAWQGDRFAHQVQGLLGGQWVHLLQSLEDSAAGDWPPAPPLQSGQLEARAGPSPVALLVGMAGKSHWSLAVQVVESGALLFDVACRVREPPGFLGSIYTLPPRVTAERPGDGHAMRLAGRGGAVELAPANQDGACHVTAAGNRITVVARAAPRSVPATIRWRYALRVM
jgi:hypothetical protein